MHQSYLSYLIPLKWINGKMPDWWQKGCASLGLQVSTRGFQLACLLWVGGKWASWKPSAWHMCGCLCTPFHCPRGMRQVPCSAPWSRCALPCPGVWEIRSHAYGSPGLPAGAPLQEQPLICSVEQQPKFWNPSPFRERCLPLSPLILALPRIPCLTFLILQVWFGCFPAPSKFLPYCKITSLVLNPFSS